MTISLLAHQSPKTYGWLRRSVDHACLDRIEEVYSWAITAGANDEHHLNRTEGASFNPRPARLVLLLAQEGGRRDRLSLGASVFLSVASRFESLSGTHQFPFLEEMKLARTALNPQEISVLSGEARDTTRELHLVWLLDLLRHLHMQHRTADALRTALDNLELSRKELPPLRESRLQLLVDAHIERLRRQL